MVSGSISLLYSRFFSPFPHGTGSLSVSQEYLALPDGTGRFRRDFAGPALLRIPLWLQSLRWQGYHLLWPTFPGSLASIYSPTLWSYNPVVAVTTMVWALPRSLATTWGIIFIFSSSGYLDVSVLRVCFPLTGYLSFTQVGCPIRKSADQLVCANPRSLSQLITSFIAFESLGIPHTLLVTFFKIVYSLLIGLDCSKLSLWILLLFSLLSMSKNFFS